ncbi:hypothetical protein IJG10_02360, partial [Candidatus Saccharibacteria bacterium]|nr:hypothetical protein [Candidatus Saccharibacteria bacterium]
MKNKFLIFLPLLFSFFLFLFVCFNFTDSNVLGHAIEKESSFFADAGSFKADLDSLDSLAAMYEKSEENALPDDFLQTKIQSVISRNAQFIKNESGERLSARIEDFSAKIAAKGEELAEAAAEEKPRITASLRTDISTLKDMADLAARQKLGILQYSYFVWQDFINKTVIAVSALFLLANVILTVLLLKKRKSAGKVLSLIGLGANASVDDAAEEIRKLTEAKSAELDEIGKKYAREQIVGKRKEDLLNAIPEGLSAAASGRVTFVNKTMKEWFGVDGSFIGEEMKTVFDKVGTDGAEGKFVNGEETYQLSVSLGQNETFY